MSDKIIPYENPQKKLYQAIASGSLPNLYSAFAAGAILSTPNEMGELPLHMAIEHGQVAILQALIGLDADIEARNRDGYSPLDLAVMKESTKYTRFLLKAGVDVHATNEGNRQALHRAAYHNRMENCELLLAFGATLDLEDGHRGTPVSTAFSRGFIELGSYLQDVKQGKMARPEPDTGIARARENSIEAMKRVRHAQLKKNIRMRPADDAPEQIEVDKKLFEAIRLGKFEDAKEAIELGANVHARDAKGRRPLHYAAAEYSDGACMRLLLKYGADLEARDLQGNSALHETALSMAPGGAVALLERGANVNAQNRQGDTPLHLAVPCYGDTQTYRILLAAGANLHIPGKDGRSVLDTAAAGRNPERFLYLQDIDDGEAYAKHDGSTKEETDRIPPQKPEGGYEKRPDGHALGLDLKKRKQALELNYHRRPFKPALPGMVIETPEYLARVMDRLQMYQMN